MNDQSWKRKESKEQCPGLVLGKTTVIVNRRTAVFVTRDRAQGQPANDNCPLKICVAFWRDGPVLTREFLKARMKAEL
jgi:hypothetical protein